MTELTANAFISENSPTNLVVKNNTNSESQGTAFNPKITIVWGNQEEQNTIAFNLKTITNSAMLFKNSEKREELLILAVKNFLRKANTSELNDALNYGDISGEYYNSELDKNAYKYEISINKLRSPEDAVLIYELVNKIGFDIRDISVSEVSEMFSVEEKQLISSIKSLSHKVLINGKTQ